MAMDAEAVARFFTGEDGEYRFARWGRPLAPVLFGVEAETLGIFKAAFGAVAGLTRHGIAETDVEMGANVLVFLVRDWAEFCVVPDMAALVPGIGATVARLEAAGANQYRLFRFEAGGAIRAAFLFLRIDDALAVVPVADLALDQLVRLVLLWGERAFVTRGPLGRLDGGTVLWPEIAALIRVAQDPGLPDSATDPAHGLRLAARLPADVVFS